jgi:protein O-mannosyl-transferase
MCDLVVPWAERRGKREKLQTSFLIEVLQADLRMVWRLMDRTALKSRGILLVLLAAVTLAAFWPVLRNDFIKYDDSQYISDNPRVLSGLTWANIGWALRSGYGSNWHPLTWLSHMLDVQLFGLKPFGHHLTNLLFHTTNALLLMLVLNRMTKAVWRSLFVAALFALHPLHVESVAWVAERKDVLSTFFFLLTLLAYSRYAGWKSRVDGPQSTVQGPQSAGSAGRARRAYLWALGWFGLGLMSKPMLVTTPFVLLLLDYWPLQRFHSGKAAGSYNNAGVLLREKVPFLFLALLSSAVTFVAQEKSQVLMAGLPPVLRVANAVTSYLKYLGKTIWPTHLAIFYPHPNLRFFAAGDGGLYPNSQQWPAWEIFAGVLLLLAVSCFFFLRRREQPWLLVGWLWYLGTLVPVIGLVQVGTQAMADRYTYIPSIGIFVAFVWTAAALVSGVRLGRVSVVLAGIVALGCCAVLTRRQTSYWRDNYTVFSHALAVTYANPVAEFSVGAELLQRKQYGLAQAHLRHALLADPNYAEAYAGLGYLFESLGKFDRALDQYRISVRLHPWDDLSRCHIASILEQQGRRDEAIAQYQEALRLNPDNVLAHYHLGVALCDSGQLDEGASQCAAALRLKPDLTDALICLADATARQGKLPEAETALRQLVRLHPGSSELRVNLGTLLVRQGRADEAVEQYASAIRLNPQQPVAYYDLGAILAAQGKTSEAAVRFAEAVKLKPDYLEARVALARALAQSEKHSEAAATLHEAILLFPSNAALQLELGRVLTLAGDPIAAALATSNAWRLDPTLASKTNSSPPAQPRTNYVVGPSGNPSK